MKRVLATLVATVAMAGTATTSAQAVEDELYFISGSKQISPFATADIRVVCPGNFPHLVAGTQGLTVHPEGIQINAMIIGTLANDPLDREYVTFNLTNNWNTYKTPTVATFCRK